MKWSLGKVLALCAVMVVWGCSGSSPQSTVEVVCGEGGQIVDAGVTRACVYDNPLLIETGFECPPGLPHMHNWGDLVICSGSDELPDAFYDELEGRYPNGDYPERCFGDVCASDERCIEGFCAVVDPCANLACGAEERCLDGACIPLATSCDGVECADNSVCDMGECVVVDPCSGVECEGDLICMEGMCVDPPGPCSDFPELAQPENAVEKGFDASYSVTGDNWRTACIDEGFENGKDRGFQFTAPSAGEWLLMARGEHLWSFSARDTCDDVSETVGCDSNTSFHNGNAFGAAKGFRVTLDAGERVYMNLDGCPTPMNCTYEVKAIQPVLEGEACTQGWSGWRTSETPTNGCGEEFVCPNIEEGSVCLAISPPEIVRADEAKAYKVNGEVLVAFYGRDASLDAQQARVELLDAEGVGLPRYVGGPSEGRAYAVDRVYGTEEFEFRFRVGEFDADAESIARAETVRVVLIDAEELETAAILIEITDDIPSVAEGEECDQHVISELCEGETYCRQFEGEGPWSCTRIIPPTVLSAQVMLNTEQSTYAVDATWSDPNSDALWVKIAFLNDADEQIAQAQQRVNPPTLVEREGDMFTIRRSGYINNITGDVTTIAQARIVVADVEDLESAPLNTALSETVQVERGASCDRLGARNRCAEDDLCDGLIVEGVLEEPLCHALVSECADDVDVVDINAHEGDGVWRHSQDLSGLPALAACDGEMPSGQGTQVYSFTAPEAGRFQFTASSDFEPNPILAVRRHCQFSGRDSQLSCNEFGDYHAGLTWSVLELEADETVYLLMDDWLGDRTVTLTVGPEM